MPLFDCLPLRPASHDVLPTGRSSGADSPATPKPRFGFTSHTQGEESSLDVVDANSGQP
jgi:hypothetical protein